MSQKHHKNIQNQNSANVKVSSSWYDDFQKYAMYVLVFCLIFFHSIEFFAVFATPKIFCLRLISILILILFGYKILKEKEINLRSGKFSFFLSLYAGVSILNTIFTVNYHTSLFGIPDRYLGLFTTLNFVFISFICAQIFKTQKQIIVFLKYFVVLGFIASLYGLGQFYKLIGDPSLWDQDPTQRVFGTFGHANHFAAFLGMNAMLSLGFCLYSKDIKAKIFYLITFFLSFITIIDTASRGGLIAFLIALIFFVIYSIYLFYRKLKAEDQGKRFLKYSTIALAAFIIISIFLSPLLVSKFKQSFLYQRLIVLEQNYEKGFVPDRLSWWFSMFEMIKDKPILGHGLSTFKDIYNNYRRLDYRNPDDLQYEIEPEAGHMEYLNIAATQGLLGLILYLIPIIYVFAISVKYIKNKDRDPEEFILIGLLSALLVYLSQVLLSFGVVDTWTIFFILLGLTVAFVELRTESLELRTENLGKFANVIFIISILISINYFFFATSQLRQDFWRRQATSAEILKNYNHAISSYERIIELENSAFYMTDYADFLIRLALNPDFQDKKEIYLKKAIEMYERALASNDLHSYIYSNMGLAQIRLAEFYQNDPSLSSDYIMQSIRNYEIAVNKSPNNPLHLYNLMRIYALTNQFDKFYTTGDQILAMRPDYKDTLNLLIQIAKNNGNKEMQEKYQLTPGPSLEKEGN